MWQEFIVRYSELLICMNHSMYFIYAWQYYFQKSIAKEEKNNGK